MAFDVAATKTLFLPGARGDAGFWEPVAALIATEAVFLSWPGLGHEPEDPAIGGFDDLVAMVLRRIDGPVNIVAQSLGGLVALRVAQAAPEAVRRMVLVATSGGLPVADLGGSDWRADYFAAYPLAARWIADPTEDLSAVLPLVDIPALLLWGNADPISPVAVGERLRHLLPRTRLRVIPGGDHDLALTHAPAVAAAIREDWT